MDKALDDELIKVTFETLEEGRAYRLVARTTDKSRLTVGGVLNALEGAHQVLSECFQDEDLLPYVPKPTHGKKGKGPVH